ncbi:7153_t:CDS:2 [Diversispora eburnea]|uniref:7153_t:CDS:1 n=1 Tax=Diversispora eburnea TaxID=1213867 RepID=A0A9N8YLS7_9GLOM|nr:7153_t:CDS:2 [Diversispora eburnea]
MASKKPGAVSALLKKTLKRKEPEDDELPELPRCRNKILGKLSESIISLTNEIKKLNTSQTNMEQKIIRDNIRRNLFIQDKYPNDIKTEKFCRDILMKLYPSNSTYSDRTKWDTFWCNFRTHALDMIRVLRENTVKSIYHQFNEIFENKAKIAIAKVESDLSTQRALYFLKTIKSDDERTYLNIITLNVFNYDKGSLKGTNTEDYFSPEQEENDIYQEENNENEDSIYINDN